MSAAEADRGGPVRSVGRDSVLYHLAKQNTYPLLIAVVSFVLDFGLHKQKALMLRGSAASRMDVVD